MAVEHEKVIRVTKGQWTVSLSLVSVNAPAISVSDDELSNMLYAMVTPKLDVDPEAEVYSMWTDLARQFANDRETSYWPYQVCAEKRSDDGNIIQSNYTTKVK